MAGELWQSIRPYLTDWLAAAGIILLGSIVGRFLETGGKRASQALLDRLGGRGSGAAAVGAAAVARSVPVLVGRLVYWLAFLVALAAAVQVLGLPVVSGVVERITEYL